MAMLYLVNLQHCIVAMRFQMAMLVSAWINFTPDLNHSNFKSLEVMMRGHWEMSRVDSFYGPRNTS